jgi:hypothetical protein
MPEVAAWALFTEQVKVSCLAAALRFAIAA